MKKIIKIFIFLFLACCILNNPTWAQSPKGSISIQLNTAETITFGINTLATIKNNQIIPKPTYQDYDFQTINTSQENEKLAHKIMQHIKKPDQTITTNSLGFAHLSNLETGVYLLYSLDKRVTPFILTIPTYNSLEHHIIFDLTVYPKVDHDLQLKILKADSKTNQLITNLPFEFKLYYDESCLHEFNTASIHPSLATATFYIPHGTWYLKETKAPSGYLKSNQIFKIEYDSTLKINHQLIDYPYTYTIYNDPLPYNPNTKDPTPLVLYFILGVFSGLGIVKLKKNKKV